MRRRRRSVSWPGPPTGPLSLASDTHDLTERSPDLMARAKVRAASFVGDEEAVRMVDERPRAMVTP